MTKKSEIELVDSFIQQAPRDSYVGAMLRHIRPQIEADIRSDFIPQPDLAFIERDIVSARERLAELQKQQATVAQEIAHQRSLQASIYNRLTECQRDLNSTMAAIVNTLRNFSK